MNHSLFRTVSPRVKSALSFFLSFVLIFQTLGPGVIAVKDVIAQTVEGTVADVAIVAPACTTTTIYSDAKTVSDNSDGWTEGFSDVLTTIHPAWTADVDGTETQAQWIWSENPVLLADTQVDTKKNFYRKFSVSATTSEAHIVIAADNFYKVWINNVLAGSEQADNNNFAIETQDTIDITNLLVPGDNWLRVEVTNQGVLDSDQVSNPAGLLYALSYTIGNCGNGGEVPVNPGSSGLMIRKYVDGMKAATSTFTLDVNMQWGGGQSFSGNLILNARQNYTEDTEKVTNGNNSISITEVVQPNSHVLPFGSPCQPGKFRLAGYTVGSSFAEAERSGGTTTADSLTLTNITERTYVIVWNETCPPAPAVQLSDVTLCKEDSAGNRLEGWELSLGTSTLTMVGTTTADDLGCVTFDDVAYGMYDISEIDQAGWKNVSGLGLVTVASSTHQFIVVNELVSTTTCVDCGNGGGGDGGNTPITTGGGGLTSARSGGGSGSSNNTTFGAPIVAGAFSQVDPEGEVLGEFTEMPGIPNTGLGTSGRSSGQTALTILFAGLALLLASNFLVLRKEKLS